MSQQSSSVVILRPPQEVFAYLDDISREHEWQPNLVAAEQVPPGATQVGTQKRYTSLFMGQKIKNSYAVTELEPGRRVVYETQKGSAVDARSEIVCEAEGEGTRVTISVDGKPKGVLRFVPKAALEFASREELKSTLVNLKKRLESGAGSAS
jgi:carbon monoxide dehydrogenase subunit G